MEKRLPFSDNLKSFALILGILFHSSIIFSEQDGYCLKNLERAFWFDIITKFVHLFRMPLFFFLAGFFSESVYLKKGVLKFCKNRFNRLIVPLIFGVLFFSPVEKYFSNSIFDSNISYSDFYFRFFNAKNFDFSHLWFLYYLALFSSCLFIFKRFRNMLPKFFKHEISGNICKLGSLEANQTDLKLSDCLYYLFLGIIFSFGLSLFVHSFFIRGYYFFRIDPVVFAYYLSFFLSGVYGFKRSILNFKNFNVPSFILTLVFIFLLFVLFFIIDSKDPYWTIPFEMQNKKIRMIHLFLEATLTWTIIFFLTAFFKKYLNFENQFTLYLKKSSLPVYLVHHPVSILFGYFLVKIKIDQTEKFLFHFFFVLFASFIFYDGFIKRSAILNLFLGNKNIGSRK